MAREAGEQVSELDELRAKCERHEITIAHLCNRLQEAIEFLEPLGDMPADAGSLASLLADAERWRWALRRPLEASRLLSDFDVGIIEKDALNQIVAREIELGAARQNPVNAPETRADAD